MSLFQFLPDFRIAQHIINRHGPQDGAQRHDDDGYRIQPFSGPAFLLQKYSHQKGNAAAQQRGQEPGNPELCLPAFYNRLKHIDKGGDSRKADGKEEKGRKQPSHGHLPENARKRDENQGRAAARIDAEGKHRRHYSQPRKQRRHRIKQLSLIHISEPTRLGMISYAVFCLKKK